MLLSYTEGKFLLDLPGWNKSQIEALLQKLVTWQKVRGSAQIWAEPLVLAYREIKEAIPELKRGKNIDLFLGDYSGKTVPFPLPLPLEDRLYPHQVTPTKLLAQRNVALLTAAPGLGKTVMACVALQEHYWDRILIVAPKSLLKMWEREVRKWYLDELDYEPGKLVVWGEIKDVAPTSASIIITSLNVITGLVKRDPTGWEVHELFSATDSRQIIILDESFSYKNRNTKRAKAAKLVAGYFGHRWLLSGMPIAKYSDDLYMQLSLLYPVSFRSYWSFTRRYCLIEDNYWASVVVGDKPGAEALLKKDLKDILIECEYPETIPGWKFEYIAASFSTVQARIYKDLEDKMRVEAEALGSDKPLTVKSLIALTTRLLQAASNPALLGGTDISAKEKALLRDLRTADLPALIWVQYIETANLLKERLARNLPKLRVALLTGATLSGDRDSVVRAFQAGEIDLLIVHPGVGKYGHTLTSAKTVYYLERNYNAEEFYQTLFRARRITSTHEVRAVLLVATQKPGVRTIDHVVDTVLKERTKKAQKLTVGRLLSFFP